MSINSWLFGFWKRRFIPNLSDKLFNSLVKNSDTIYLMYDNKNRELVYMTHNLVEVLGLKINENEKSNHKIPLTNSTRS